jgi:hypothetical protein
MWRGRFWETVLLLVCIVSFFQAAVVASQYGAVGNGLWGSAATWTPAGGPPGPSDTAFIGSVQPTGAAGMSTVTLDANHSVNELFVGFGAGTVGQLALDSSDLLVAGTVYLGRNGGTGVINSNGGTLTASAITVEGQNVINLSPGDRIHRLTLGSGGQASMASSNNVDHSVTIVDPNSELVLDADLNLLISLIVGGGTLAAPAVLDANGRNITVQNLTLGQSGKSELRNDGAIAVTNVLTLHDTDFVFDSNDQAAYVDAYNSDIALHPTTQIISLILNGSSSTVLHPGNQLQFLSLYNSQVTTIVADTNVTRGLRIHGPATQATLMADLTLNSVIVEGGTSESPAVLDADGYNIVAQDLTIDNRGGAELRNDGAIEVNLLTVYDGPFEMDANDAATYIVAYNAPIILHPTTQAYSLTLNGTSSATLFPSNQFRFLSLANSQETAIVSTSNVSDGIALTGSRTQLTLATNLELAQRLQVNGGRSIPNVLDAAGHDIIARELWFGLGGGETEFRNDGLVTISHLMRTYSDISLRGGFDIVMGQLEVFGDATLQVTQEDDHTRGLSFEGDFLTIATEAVLRLDFDDTLDPFGEWILRWSGDKVSEIHSLINDGRIVVHSPHPFSVVNNGDGFTYIARFEIDFNGDERSNCADLASLGAAIVHRSTDLQFDLTGDGLVTVADRDAWLAHAGRIFLRSGNPYRPGDANLDGLVDGTDFGIWNAHKFTENSSWCEGDFTTDGVVDGSDFGIWNANKFTSALIVVPEPSYVPLFACSLVIVSFLAKGCTQRRSANFSTQYSLPASYR